MKEGNFLARHGIVRNAIRDDMLFFAIPALLVFTAGLVLSARDGYDGLVETIWGLVRHPERLSTLSGPNIAGLLLFAVGLTFAIVAASTLHRFYSSTLVTREDHKLITHGVYSFTRHPIYLGVIIAVIGVPMYAMSLYGFVAMLALIPVFLNRIRIEERLLTEEFGDAYRTYRETTSKLIPFVY